MRESWAKLFAGGPRARLRITQQVAISAMMLTVHSVQENFIVEGDARAEASGRPQGRDSRPAPIVATNIYQRSASGWRMVLHHASPAPGETPPAPPREAAPKTLH